MFSKFKKIIFFSIFFIFFGSAQVTEAINNFSEKLVIDNDIEELLAKEGSSAKKSGDKKSSAKKSGDKKSSAKTSGDKKSSAKKSGDKKSGDKKTGGKKVQENLKKVESNIEIIREKARERYIKWKENKKSKKN